MSRVGTPVTFWDANADPRPAVITADKGNGVVDVIAFEHSEAAMGHVGAHWPDRTETDPADPDAYGWSPVD